MDNQSNEEILTNTNLVVLANAIEIVSDTIMSIAGNEIANTIDSKLVTLPLLQSVVGAKIYSKLTPIVRGL